MEEGKNLQHSTAKLFNFFHNQSFFFLLSILCAGEKETQMTGVYDLVAVLTHKGRSADSGHYVGWVKQENGWF